MTTLSDKMQRFHRSESGAVVLMVLAAMLGILMLALVVMDTGQAGRDKIRVQAAADTAAWSEAAVEARSMNMIAFANVAKRVTIGMTAFYDALWLSYVELLAAAIAVTLLCWIADIPALGALTPVCEKLTEFTIAVFTIMANEASDGAAYIGLNTGYFKDDVTAFNNYQTYMAELAPWWAYAEGVQRGMRNGAAVSASFPVPPNSMTTSDIGVDLPGLSLEFSGMTDSLPTEQVEDLDDAVLNTCSRVYSDLDFAYHLADYLIQSEMTNSDVSSPWGMVATAIAGVLATAQVIITCPLQMAAFGEASHPWRVKNYDDSASGKAKWVTDTSNLTFAYRPSKDRMKKDRNKFQIMGGMKKLDQGILGAGDILYGAGGYWAMSRSEISYQNGAPDMWHPSWAARMRPVAIPGEWSNNDTHLGNALIDVLPVMIVGAGVQQLSAGDADLGNAISDLTRIILATQAYNDTNMSGLSK